MERERALPLTEKQRVELLQLIQERDSIINNKSTAPGITVEKQKVWAEICCKFNALYPDQHPRSSKQLKRSYDHVKRKVKDGDREFRKKIKTTGGGPPPSPPKPTEEIAIATSMMEVDLAMGTDVFDTFELAPVDGRNDANVIVLQHEDDPDDPVGQSILPTNVQPSVQSAPATSSSTPVCLGTVQGGNVTSTPSSNQQVRKKRRTAKDDSYLCRTRQEEFHRLKIAQMKEVHALEVEQRKIEIENAKKQQTLLCDVQVKVESVHTKLMAVLESAKRAYDMMGPADDM